MRVRAGIVARYRRRGDAPRRRGDRRGEHAPPLHLGGHGLAEELEQRRGDIAQVALGARPSRHTRRGERVQPLVGMVRVVRPGVVLEHVHGAGPDLPDATRDALAALRPLGAKAAGGAQVVRVGDVARPPGVRTTDITGRDPFALARALDAFQTAARGKSSDRVVVVSADDPAFAMPAAAWAAKTLTLVIEI